jgi:hypothetical protein
MKFTFRRFYFLKGEPAGGAAHMSRNAKNAALLARIAELSSLINGNSKKRQKTSNKVYERPVAVAAVNDVLHQPAPPAQPPAPKAVARFDRKKKRFVNPVWSRPDDPVAQARTLSPRPAPLQVRKKFKERLAKKKAVVGGKNRVTVFREEGSFRKMKPNVLARTESVVTKALSLKVPKKKQRPVCSFFLRGECHKVDCEYSHVNVGADAPVCEDFQKGYCDLGDDCKKRHVLKQKQERKRKKEKESKALAEDDKAENEEDEFDDQEEFIKL